MGWSQEMPATDQWLNDFIEQVPATPKAREGVTSCGSDLGLKNKWETQWRFSWQNHRKSLITGRYVVLISFGAFSVQRFDAVRSFFWKSGDEIVPAFGDHVMDPFSKSSKLILANNPITVCNYGHMVISSLGCLSQNPQQQMNEQLLELLLLHTPRTQMTLIANNLNTWACRLGTIRAKGSLGCKCWKDRPLLSRSSASFFFLAKTDRLDENIYIYNMYNYS